MSVSCGLEDAVSFEPLGGVTSIFFDDKSFQIFSVRSGGATGVIVKGFSEILSSTFRLEDKGPIVSIKLSPDQKVLSVQRTKSVVEFFNIVQLGANGALGANSYDQPCKNKASTILGFYWNSPNEIVYLTTHGIEIYSVLHEKRAVKSTRNTNQLMAWFVFCPISSILVVSTSKVTSSLFAYHLKNGNVYKLPKIEIDVQQSKIEVKEKDIQILKLYKEQYYVAVIIHPGESRSNFTSSEVHLYAVNKESGTTSKSHVLRTNFNGVYGLAMHSIDDVLVVHNRKAGETTFFDIGLSGEFDGAVSHHAPVGPVARIPTVADNEEYPAHWVIFGPDIVIDANSGVMWHLKLKFSTVKVEDALSSYELPRLISFLLQRSGAKRVLLDTLLDWCRHHTTDLSAIGNSFDRINREYRLYIDLQLAPSVALPASAFSQAMQKESASNLAAACQPPSKVVLDQSDVYTNILSPMLEMATLDQTMSLKRVIAIVTEYLRSLEERQIPAQHFLHELLINLLVRSGQWYQLHQLLQYHIIADSKPKACLLLSLEAAYPAAFQLAMDMLSRLKTSGEEITEILLSKGKVISALLYANSHGLERQIPARKFLQASLDTGDKEIFVHTKKWLKDHQLLSAKDAHDYDELNFCDDDQ